MQEEVSSRKKCRITKAEKIQPVAGRHTGSEYSWRRRNSAGRSSRRREILPGEKINRVAEDLTERRRYNGGGECYRRRVNVAEIATGRRSPAAEGMYRRESTGGGTYRRRSTNGWREAYGGEISTAAETTAVAETRQERRQVSGTNSDLYSCYSGL